MAITSTRPQRRAASLQPHLHWDIQNDGDEFQEDALGLNAFMYSSCMLHTSLLCRLTWHQDVKGYGDERQEYELGLELGVQGGHCHHNSVHCPAHAQAARGHSSPQAPGVGHQAAGHTGAGKEGKKLGGAVVLHQEGACMQQSTADLCFASREKVRS